VYRAEIEPGEESAPQDVSQVKLKSTLAMQGSPSSAEFSDTRFEFGETYLYTVRAVAQYGADAIESADSSPAVVTPRDTFAPATPVGLQAAIIPATPEASARVELSWAISSEGDLAGYHVYRSDLDNTPGERINREVLPSPTFRDTSVVSGKRYFYRVRAVDRAGNESPLGPTVQIEVP
jgi:predicted phage tail protein